MLLELRCFWLALVLCYSMPGIVDVMKPVVRAGRKTSYKHWHLRFCINSYTSTTFQKEKRENSYASAKATSIPFVF